MYGIPYRKGSSMNNPHRGDMTTDVTVLLTNDQIATLDEISAAIRRNTGHAVSRSALLRAMATATLPFGKDWLRCRTEDQVTQLINRLMVIGSTLNPHAK
jgi:hypothetical protein